MTGKWRQVYSYRNEVWTLFSEACDFNYFLYYYFHYTKKVIACFCYVTIVKLACNLFSLHNIYAWWCGCLQLAVNLLPYIQSAMNPIIYCFMSKNFRRSLRMAVWMNCHCDPARVLRRRQTQLQFSMETRSAINGTVTSKYWPSRQGRSSTLSVVSDV